MKTSKQTISDFRFQQLCCLRLFLQRAKKYGESWRYLRNSSIIDLCLMKLSRMKEQERSCDLEVEAEDIANYMTMLLINLRKQK